MKFFTGQNVFDAALERIRFVFDEFENVVCCISGGKDSTVVFELCMQVAREKGRLPLPVFFLDQESEYAATIEIVREIMYHPDVRPLWVQAPFRLYNAASNTDHWLKVWDPEHPEKWMREKDPISIKENTFGVDRFADMLHAVVAKTFEGQRVADISGVRCEESPARRLTLTTKARYKWVTWAAARIKGRHYSFFPIYDWHYTDVWTAIIRNGWKYNRVYDLMYAHGIGVRAMRVSSLIHETALTALYDVQEFEKDTFDRLADRVAGVHSVAKMARDCFPKELPFMFRSWLEYRDFLLDKLIDEKYKPSFRKTFAANDKFFVGYPQIEKKYLMACIASVITNDWEFIKIDDFRTWKHAINHVKAVKGIKTKDEIRREREAAAAGSRNADPAGTGEVRGSDGIPERTEEARP